MSTPRVNHTHRRPSLPWSIPSHLLSNRNSSLEVNLKKKIHTCQFEASQHKSHWDKKCVRAHTLHSLDPGLWFSAVWSHALTYRATNNRRAPFAPLKMSYIYLVTCLTWAQMSKQCNTTYYDTYKISALNSQPILIFPRWLTGKESACQCRRHRRLGFDPWVRKIPWSRKW